MSNDLAASLDGSSLGGCDSFSTQPPARPDHTLLHTCSGVTICSGVTTCSGVTICSGVTNKQHNLDWLLLQQKDGSCFTW